MIHYILWFPIAEIAIHRPISSGPAQSKEAIDAWLCVAVRTVASSGFPHFFWPCVPLNPMVNDHYPYEKWLFHWEYTQHFQTHPFLLDFSNFRES